MEHPISFVEHQRSNHPGESGVHLSSMISSCPQRATPSRSSSRHTKGHRTQHYETHKCRVVESTSPRQGMRFESELKAYRLAHPPLIREICDRRIATPPHAVNASRKLPQLVVILAKDLSAACHRDRVLAHKRSGPTGVRSSQVVEVVLVDRSPIYSRFDWYRRVAEQFRVGDTSGFSIGASQWQVPGMQQTPCPSSRSS